MLSEPSNAAFARAEDARQDACEAVQKAIAELATKLRAAADIYQCADTHAGENITGTQMKNFVKLFHNCSHFRISCFHFPT
ncbi:MAG: ESX-1 secretion-associated protein [Mycobacteriaceae bacterium]|nr:ESX-1 secretion-associated protein [Mycobacteriaceae bacterium]